MLVPFGQIPASFTKLITDLGILAVGIATYGALFTFVGAWLKRPLVVGLIYVFGWEQFAMLMPGYLRRFTLAYYLQALVPHGIGDTPDGVDTAYLAQNARVNVAAAALLALAPPAPRVVNEKEQPLIGRQPSGYDANLRWLASPGAVRYRIYRRTPWSNDWESSESVGNVTQFVVTGTSIDDWVFGVAAVGQGSYESLISTYVPRSRADPPIKFAP